MDRIITLLSPLIQGYKRKENLVIKVGKMITHIMDCNLDALLKLKKVQRIRRFARELRRKIALPVKYKLILIEYYENKWKSIVRENGYINLGKTLKELNLQIELDGIKKSKEDKTLLRLSDYEKNYKHNIRPLNCQISPLKRLNKDEKVNKTLNIVSVRPSLPELNGKLYGLCVEIEQEDYSIRIYGLLDQDNLRIYRNQLDLRILYNDINDRYGFKKEDVEKYIKPISYRDLIVYDVRHITNRVKTFKDKHNFYKDIDYALVLAEYEFLTDVMKVDFISFLLEVDLIHMANYLYKRKSFPDKYLDWDLQGKISVFNCPSPKGKLDVEKLPYEFRISGMKADDKIKSKAYEKLKTMNQSGDTAPKAQKYLDGILKLPFGVVKSELDLDDPGKKLVEEFKRKNSKIVVNCGKNYLNFFEQYMNFKESEVFCKNAITKINKAREKQKDYLKKVEEIFEKYVHGHNLVKVQLKRLIAQWISGGQSGIVLGLEGPPGNGKTTLIKSGLANCLVDEKGSPRPVGFIPLGGSSNASSLVGHGFTYQGSTWGRIADILMDCQCMNPIILFDELDKVSRTEHGSEVSSILTHLTDSTQNNEFYDKYFDGVPLDLSKALMVFTFNDRSKIDPILLDRMTIIETKPLTLEDKKIVTKKHLIPQITSLVDLEPHEVKLGEDELETLILDYTFEAGARQLKKLLESLIQELNLRRLCNPSTRLEIDHFLIKDVFKHKNKIRRESISNDPLVGQINGMYANTYGLGGILPIQVDKSYTNKNLVLTGTQGDTMKESMRCAETIAFNLVSKEMPEFNREDLKYGLHIHCPSTGMPKDGPSAGVAICIAIFSFLCNKHIKQDVAITGEIDLMGRALPIGGVEAKLTGAKKAGIKIALIPKENETDLNILKSEGKDPESENFKVVIVDTIYQALPYFIEEKK